MSIQLRPKARVEVRRHKREGLEAVDWLGLWALSIGFCAVVLAGVADFLGDDKVGAAYILFGAAFIIALILGADAEPDERV